MQDAIKPVTIWLSLSVLAPDAPEILASAMQYVRSTSAQQSRLAVLFDCASTQKDQAAALMRIIHATTLLKSRVDKIPAYLAGLATDKALWKQLAASQKGALEGAIILAEKSGLNVDALKANVDSLSTASVNVLAPMLPHSLIVFHALFCPCMPPQHAHAMWLVARVLW